MAGTMIRIGRWLVLIAATGSMLGCVSTDELYADYDATLCPIEEPRLGLARAPVTLPDGGRLDWPPAVYFGYDSDALDARATGELDDAIRLLERFDGANVMITGYTSKLGSISYNRRLAARRVANVKAYLDDAGIGDSRIVDSVLGAGLEDFSPYERVANAVNRRVGLTLLDVEGRPVRHTLPHDVAPSSWPVPPPTTLRAPNGARSPGPDTSADAPDDVSAAVPVAEPVAVPASQPGAPASIPAGADDEIL